jgi:GNAT superfamily N-acetyltransferase
MGDEGISIRPARASDLDALVALDRSIRTASDQPAHAADWLDPDARGHLSGWIERGECFVAMRGAEVAGYGVFHHHFFHSGMIDLVLVSGPHRRRGVGRAMVRFFTARCRSEKVWISTNLSNTRMQQLIASEGFRMAGFVEGLDPGDPELVFSKPAQGGAPGDPAAAGFAGAGP